MVVPDATGARNEVDDVGGSGSGSGERCGEANALIVANNIQSQGVESKGGAKTTVSVIYTWAERSSSASCQVALRLRTILPLSHQLQSCSP